MSTYNIHEISILYVKGFYKFLNRYRIELSRDSAYDLFKYSMKQLCDLEATEYNLEIRKYGDKCIRYLKKLKGTPSELQVLSLEDRINLVGCCGVYFVAKNSIKVLQVKEEIM